MTKGYTVKPRRRLVSWTEAEVMTGIRFEGKAPPARMQPGPDAELVIAAIKRLEPRIAATVIACARAKIRLDLLAVEPQLVTRYKRNKRGGTGWNRIKYGNDRARRFAMPGRSMPLGMPRSRALRRN